MPFLYNERNKFVKLDERLNIAKQDYLEATNSSVDDVEFISTIDKVADDETMTRMGVKHPRLQNLVTGIDYVSDCDSVMLGRNWHRSKFCKALLSICKTYDIPVTFVTNVQKISQKTKEYYDKLKTEYNIDILYKEF